MFINKIVKQFLRNIGFAFYSLYYYEKDLDSFNEKDYISADISQEIKEASEEDIENIILMSDTETKKRIILYKKQGSMCFIALYRGKIVGYTWINKRNINIYDKILCPVKENSVFVFGSFVFPEYRGKHIFQELISFSCTEMKERGYKYISNFVSTDNIPSITARAKFNLPKKRMLILLIFNRLFLISEKDIIK